MFNESQKSECLLSISPFNTPAELAGVEAWCDLIIRLIMLKPGTYPSLPNMGVGLDSYEYETIDAVLGMLVEKINSQVKTYLPDIPVDKIEAVTHPWRHDTLIIFIIQFSHQSDLPTVSVVAHRVQNIINFEVVM